MKIVLLLFFSSSIALSSLIAHAQDCSEIKFSDLNPVASDYQPTNKMNISQAPNLVIDKDGNRIFPDLDSNLLYTLPTDRTVNPRLDSRTFYDGIQGMHGPWGGSKDLFEGNFETQPSLSYKHGLSVAGKMYASLKLDDSPDSAAMQYFGKVAKNQSDVKADPSEGSCLAWSAWSMNPELQDLFKNINDGIVCNGIGFTRGELKELVTSVYEFKETNNYQIRGINSAAKFDGSDGYRHINDDAYRTEDADVALSKLGMLGGQDVSTNNVPPDQVCGIMQKAYTQPDPKKPKQMVAIDREPGDKETWNQPVKKFTDVPSSASVANALDQVSVAEMTSTDSKIMKLMQDMEAQFIYLSAKVGKVDLSALCEVKQRLNETCDDSSAIKNSADQAEAFLKVKRELLQKDVFKTKQDFKAVQHDMTIEYGVELPFASNDKNDPIRTQHFRYVDIKWADGRHESHWNPTVKKLSKICADQDVGERDSDSNTTPEIVLKDSDKSPANKTNVHCSDADKQDYQFFTDGLPPKAFKILDREFDKDDASAEKKAAYQKLLEMLKNLGNKCPRFDDAADFLHDLKEARMDNTLSDRPEIENLRKKFLKLPPNMIYQPWLDNYFADLQKSNFDPVQIQKLKAALNYAK